MRVPRVYVRDPERVLRRHFRAVLLDFRAREVAGAICVPPPDSPPKDKTKPFKDQVEERCAAMEENEKQADVIFAEAEEKLLDQFQRADIDGNGLLSWREYCLAEAWWMSSNINPEKVALF